MLIAMLRRCHLQEAVRTSYAQRCPHALQGQNRLQSGKTAAELRKSRQRRRPSREQHQHVPMKTAAASPEPGSEEWLHSAQRLEDIRKGERMVVCAFVAFSTLACGMFAMTSHVVDTENKGTAPSSDKTGSDQRAVREEALRRVDGQLGAAEARRDR